MTLMSVPNFRSCPGLVSEKFSTNWKRFSVRDCGWFTAFPKVGYPVDCGSPNI